MPAFCSLCKVWALGGNWEANRKCLLEEKRERETNILCQQSSSYKHKPGLITGGHEAPWVNVTDQSEQSRGLTAYSHTIRSSCQTMFTFWLRFLNGTQNWNKAGHYYKFNVWPCLENPKPAMQWCRAQWRGSYKYSWGTRGHMTRETLLIHSLFVTYK